MSDLADHAEEIADASRALASRIREGCTLVIRGSERMAGHIDHLVVEFLHPVIAGKPAIPVVAGAGWVPHPFVEVVLDVPTTSPDAVDIGSWVTIAPNHHADVVAAYHLLWEGLHIWLDHTRTTTSARTHTGPANDDATSLYPFLSGGGPSDDERHDAVVASVREKAERSAQLRAATLDLHHDALERCTALLEGGGLVTFGNGGSAADAIGAAARLGGRHLLTATVVTALANDVGTDAVFARQIDALHHTVSAAMAFSTSGTSPNVRAGLTAANTHGIPTIAFVGARPVEADISFTVESDSVHRIQEAHAALIDELVARCAT